MPPASAGTGEPPGAAQQYPLPLCPPTALPVGLARRAVAQGPLEHGRVGTYKFVKMVLKPPQNSGPRRLHENGNAPK